MQETLVSCQRQMIEGMDTLTRMFKINNIQASSFKSRNKEETHLMQVILYTS
jgi:hypothetical protein